MTLSINRTKDPCKKTSEKCRKILKSEENKKISQTLVRETSEKSKSFSNLSKSKTSPEIQIILQIKAN